MPQSSLSCVDITYAILTAPRHNLRHWLQALAECCGEVGFGHIVISELEVPFRGTAQRYRMR